MIIAYCILIPILLFISGFAKAVMDLSSEGKIKFKPSRYWIKSMSSPNKWKDGDSRKGEKVSRKYKTGTNRINHSSVL
jgi:hypothetical protein